MALFRSVTSAIRASPTTESTAQSYWLVGHATLTDSLYLAIDDDNGAGLDCLEDGQLVASVKHGLLEPLVLGPRAPRDVRSWPKGTHNEFHGGAEQTI